MDEIRYMALHNQIQERWGKFSQAAWDSTGKKGTDFETTYLK